MRSSRVYTVAALLLALSHAALAMTCDPDCTSTDINNPATCIYCPLQCGTCQDIGVITQCSKPSTIHLGIDDAPLPGTNQVLDILKDKGIKATFFLIGGNVVNNGFVVQRIINEGHYVGSHTFTHLHSNALSVADLQTTFATDELAKTKQVIQEAVAPTYTPQQVGVLHYRAPYGELNKNVLAVVKAQGYTPVLWNLDINDFGGNITQMWQLLNSSIATHDSRVTSFITLYHAAEDLTLNFLPTYIDLLRQAGYTFVSAQECYGAPSLIATGSTTGGSSTSGSGSGSTNSGNTNNGGSTSTTTGTNSGHISSPAAVASPTVGMSLQLLATLAAASVALLAWAL